MEPELIIYSKNNCVFCNRAKALLAERGIAFREILIADGDLEARNRLEALSGMKTFPQIFYRDQLIGGFQQLKALDEGGGLKSHFS